MSTSKELLAAYDKAMAVMSRPCRFVEWKTYGGGDDPKSWGPFGVTRDRGGATKEIEGERWIYVFRSFSRTKSAGVWVEEIHLDKEGQMSATPMDKARVEREKRPAGVPIGKSLSFARRINGVAMEYYFFASRIRLPLSAIDEIGPDIMSYVGPINFEADDANLAGEKDGLLLVPVLDPITVAIHLHANYVAAADNLLDYTAVHEGQSSSGQDAVLRRQKKVMLARIISELISPQVDTMNQLVHLTQRQGLALQEFLDDYEEQIQFRARWRDRWCSFLTKWLRGKTMVLLAKAHLHDPIEDFHKFLIPFCLCLTRLSESPQGGQALDAMWDDRSHWIHEYILPQQLPTADIYAVIRKGGGAIMEGLKEWAPRLIANPAKYSVFNLPLTIGWVTETKVYEIEGEILFRAEVKVPKVEVKVLTFEIEPKKLKPKWETGFKTVGLILELINAAFALKALGDAYKNGSKLDLAFAIANAVGSGLDLANAVLQFTKVSNRVLGTIGFISGVIDTVLAVKDIATAYDKGDTGGMVGSFMTAGGSALGAASGAMLLLEIPGVGLVTAIGLGLVALGTAIKLAFGDNETPYHKLCRHCEWGISVGEGDYQPDYSDKPFKAWKGDYDEQLRVAVAVLCGFEIELNDDDGDLREAKLSTRWIPPGAKMGVEFHEEWAQVTDNRTWSNVFRFEDGKPPSGSGYQVTITPKGKDYLLRPTKYPGEKPTRVTNAVMGSIKSWELKKISVKARLSFEANGEIFLVPRGGPLEADLV